MSARASMQWLIRLLRLKVNDERANVLEPNQYYANDSIQLNCDYKGIDGTPVEPEHAEVTIWNPMGTEVLNDVAIDSGIPGRRCYVYRIPETGPQGVWRAEFTGTIVDQVNAYSIDFEVVISNRIWSDDELQNFLDMHRIHIQRELLIEDPDKKTYRSRYGMFEDDIKIWNDPWGNAVEATPDNSNLVDGVFTFLTEQPGNYYLDGKSYDIHASIAECMEQLAMNPDKARSWERGSVKYTQYDYMEMAKYHRSLAGTRSVKISRSYS